MNLYLILFSYFTYLTMKTFCQYNLQIAEIQLKWHWEEEETEKEEKKEKQEKEDASNIAMTIVRILVTSQPNNHNVDKCLYVWKRVYNIENFRIV